MSKKSAISAARELKCRYNVRAVGGVDRSRIAGKLCLTGYDLSLNNWDVAKVVKARGFDPRIRRFESCRPSHFKAFLKFIFLGQ